MSVQIKYKENQRNQKGEGGLWIIMSPLDRFKINLKEFVYLICSCTQVNVYNPLKCLSTMINVHTFCWRCDSQHLILLVWSDWYTCPSCRKLYRSKGVGKKLQEGDCTWIYSICPIKHTHDKTSEAIKEILRNVEQIWHIGSIALTYA